MSSNGALSELLKRDEVELSNSALILLEKEACFGKEIAIPQYNRTKLLASIVHIGVGAFHRSHQAAYLDRYSSETGDLQWGIVGAGVLPQDKEIRDALERQNYLYTVVEKSKGPEKVHIVGSHVGFILGPDIPSMLIEQLSSPETKLVTLTITEAGYKTHSVTGEFLSDDVDVQYDLKHLSTPRTFFGYITAALLTRWKKGIPPFTVLSCDNLQGNGEVCKHALLSFCALVNKELAEWVQAYGAFPNSMVDRITPATTDNDREGLRSSFGIIDRWPVVAEPFTQWVIEDTFSMGRPALEKVGVTFVPNVAPYEKMKLRLLNASHSAMGYLGYLCGYRYIHEIAADPRFEKFICSYMEKEALPTLDPVAGVNLTQYCSTLIERFKNPAIKDQALRICKDGSAKIPRFILATVRDQLKEKGHIHYAAFVVAAWWRFLQGIDEQGNEIPLNDPLGSTLQEAARRGVEAFLSLEEIFGDLGERGPFKEEVTKIATFMMTHGAEETLRRVLAA